MMMTFKRHDDERQRSTEVNDQLMTFKPTGYAVCDGNVSFYVVGGVFFSFA